METGDPPLFHIKAAAEKGDVHGADDVATGADVGPAVEGDRRGWLRPGSASIVEADE